MVIDLGDEVLQDFLLEATEIVELLAEQLIKLEQASDDYDLLNAIFRGFHTIKGGAGFLGIDPLVGVCHKAEDVFNCLRQGERKVTQELMDVVLQALDVVNDIFACLREGKIPEATDKALLQRLHAFSMAQANPVVVVPPQPVAPVKVAAVTPPAHVNEAPGDTITEAEFDALLDQLQGKQEAPATKDAGATSAGNSDIITEAEFDEFLDQIQAKKNQAITSALQRDATKAIADPVSDNRGDEITEAEFDALLDQIQAKKNQATRTITGSEGNNRGDEITEAEFDALLDQIQATKNKPTVLPVSQVAAMEAVLGSVSNNHSDEISDTEFENLLDELHGKGQFLFAPQATPLSGGANELPVATAPFIEALSAVKTVESKEPIVSAQMLDGSSQNKPSPKPSNASQAETTVRVDTHVLDKIMNLVGELVLIRNRFQTLRMTLDVDEQMNQTLSNLDIVTADLQLAVMKTRMQPIKKVFGRFPRVVRDLARSLNKEIRLELVGEETDLDKNLVEALADPLVHLVRNSVDHGVETPDVREAAGKPREGVIILTAAQVGDHIELSIKDDGKGMNADYLRAKVVEKGLMDAETVARLDKKECFNFIFMPGFSTKTEISDISGRGVGMDVVKTRISQMNGTVGVDSTEGVGTTIIIKLPLTLAIMPTLMVKLGKQVFALPLANVLEILDLDLSTSNVVDGQLVMMVREKALPLFHISDWLINDATYVARKDGMGYVVVVSVGGRQVGFVVDQLIGQEEVVIKALGAKLQGVVGLSGATVTGDGRIALILDVPGLMQKYAH